MNDNIEIGRRIKSAREEKGMTQEELGKILGLNKSSIQRYETGKIQKIKLPILENIAFILDVNPSWLALKTDDPKYYGESTNAPGSLGQRIKQRRQELGLSVDELAEKLNKNSATIYKYENDEIEKLPTTVLKPLAKALNTTPSALMSWEDEKNNDSFWSRFCELCKEKGVGPTKVVKELGFSSGNLSRWKNGIEPKGSTLLTLAYYFNVSTDYLLTGKEKTSESIEVSEIEKEILEMYTQLSDEKKEIFKKFLNSL